MRMRMRFDVSKCWVSAIVLLECDRLTERISKCSLDTAEADLTTAAGAALAESRIGVWPGDAERWAPEVVDAAVVL